jgi:pyridoxamine 5'-phosphate oxidase
MNAHECIEFAVKNPVCSLATVEGDKPRVRMVLLWKADPTGFYFVLLSGKSVSDQLKASPKAEVCFFNHPSDLGAARQLRVNGRMELVKTPELQAQAVKDRAFLSQIAGKPIEHLFEVFRLGDCDAHFWSMGDILKEPTVEHLRMAC